MVFYEWIKPAKGWYLNNVFLHFSKKYDLNIVFAHFDLTDIHKTPFRLGPVLLIWVNFNPNWYNLSYADQNIKWDY